MPCEVVEPNQQLANDRLLLEDKKHVHNTRHPLLLPLRGDVAFWQVYGLVLEQPCPTNQSYMVDIV